MGSVAIIGAGPAGIATARSLEARGLRAEVFDRADQVGGLWRQRESPNDVCTWSGMRCNLSRATMSFGDISMPGDLAGHATTEEVRDYLNTCVSTLSTTVFRLHSRVTRISRCDGGRFVVRWQDTHSEEEHSAVYSQVVLCTGVFNTPKLPVLDASVPVIHSAHCQGDDAYLQTHFGGRRVLVVGSGFSGTELACLVAERVPTAKLTVALGRPRYYLHRMLDDTDGVKRPLDHVFYSVDMRDHPEDDTSDQNDHNDPNDPNSKQHIYLRRQAKSELATIADWRLAPPRGGARRVAITDHFVELVALDRIAVRRNLCEIQRNFAVFGPQVPSGQDRKEYFDIVLACTGFTCDLSFLSEELQQQLGYDAKSKQPVLAQEGVFPCVGPCDLACVGVYNGPYFGVIKQQAEWVADVFSSTLAVGSDTERAQVLTREVAQRELADCSGLRQPQFVREYGRMMASLGRLRGVWPPPVDCVEGQKLRQEICQDKFWRPEYLFRSADIVRNSTDIS
ncbi:MAG: hypothetical protein MHM6MM_002629 [Cercozoa sp. M6MM]